MVPPAAFAVQGQRAGVASRTAAMIVDALAVAALMGGAYLGIAGILFLLHGSRFAWPALTRAELGVIAYSACVLYLTAVWATTGRSVGKRLFGLRVVTRRGRHLGPWLAFVRANACVLFPMLLFWCAVSRGNRSVQDVVLRTSVVYDWHSRAPHGEPASADDALGVAVDVAAPVAHEADDGHAEALPRLDSE